MEEENNKEHHICLGGCGGVSATPGTCSAEGCQNQGKPLEMCTCFDEAHKVDKDGGEKEEVMG
jgi:hypothetical protein